MARGVKKVILVGNCGQDPETSYTLHRSLCYQFEVATSSHERQSDGDQQERTEGIELCLNRLADCW